MKTRKVLRTVSLAMLAAAVVFVLCALSDPTLGSTMYIGGVGIGADVWRALYAVYLAVMIVLFSASFAVRDK